MTVLAEIKENLTGEDAAYLLTWFPRSIYQGVLASVSQISHLSYLVGYPDDSCQRNTEEHCKREEVNVLSGNLKQIHRKPKVQGALKSG